MNRLLAQLPGPVAPTRAVNMGPTPPRILAGSATVAQLGLGPRALEAKAIDNPELQAALGRLYGHEGDLARTLQEARESRSEMGRSMATAEARSRQAQREAQMSPGSSGDNGRSSDPLLMPVPRPREDLQPMRCAWGNSFKPIPTRSWPSHR